LPTRTFERYYPQVVGDLNLREEHIVIKYQDGDRWGRPHCVKIAYRSPTGRSRERPHHKAGHFFLNAADECGKTAKVNVRGRDWYRGKQDLGASISGESS